MPRHDEPATRTLPSAESSRTAAERADPAWDERKGELACANCGKQVVLSARCTYATHLDYRDNGRGHNEKRHKLAVRRTDLLEHLAAPMEAGLVTVEDLERARRLTIVD